MNLFEQCCPVVNNGEVARKEAYWSIFQERHSVSYGDENTEDPSFSYIDRQRCREVVALCCAMIKKLVPRSATLQSVVDQSIPEIMQSDLTNAHELIHPETPENHGPPPPLPYIQKIPSLHVRLSE